MPPKGSASKEITQTNTREAVEKTSVDLPMYSSTQLFIENRSTLTWKQVNEDLSAKSLEADLEDQ